MTLINNFAIDKLIHEREKDKPEFIEYVIKEMERSLVKAILENIEHCKEYKIKLHDADYYEDFCTAMCGYKMLLDVDELEWIPCSERLPRDLQKAIACNADGEMMVGTYTTWGWIFPGYFADPIAWMPLPEPYKENEDG